LFFINAVQQCKRKELTRDITIIHIPFFREHRYLHTFNSGITQIKSAQSTICTRVCGSGDENVNYRILKKSSYFNYQLKMMSVRAILNIFIWNSSG